MNNRQYVYIGESIQVALDDSEVPSLIDFRWDTGDRFEHLFMNAKTFNNLLDEIIRIPNPDWRDVVKRLSGGA